MTQCVTFLTMHVQYIETRYNCKARLHTCATRTGQYPQLPCTNTADLYNTAVARARWQHPSQPHFSNEELSACDKDDAILPDRDSYINIMTVISLPPL